jgi:hypothetical protein
LIESSPPCQQLIAVVTLREKPKSHGGDSDWDCHGPVDPKFIRYCPTLQLNVISRGKIKEAGAE